MVPILAAALLAAQPAEPKLSEDGDFQCLAVVAVALDQAPKQSLADLKTVTGLTAIFMYYLGRVDVRYPGLDFVAAFKNLEADPGFKSRFAGEAQRCGADAERRAKQLQDIGRSLDSQRPAVPGRAG